ncbi:hypothetical protein RE628_24785 [Paenibacillus sp. D2_2]|nr:hypothetical protein [Paenibacillus sp. D2_2]WMT40388.1 hypothetical protein RE628_24785 [Paenibacillus sp. D2_2]
MKKLFPLTGIYSISAIVMLLGAIILVPIFKHKPKEENVAAAPETP